MTSATPRRILVVGSGAREHALAWKLGSDPGVERILVAPGNAGMTDVADVRPAVPATDPAAILDLARGEEVDLVAVGPEGPLVDGLADELRRAGMAVFGPGAEGARLEGSKSFCRDIATAAGVPMAEGASFESLPTALGYAQRLGPPLVVKADGLAAGKGVTVCDTLGEAEQALVDALVLGVFGSAGRRVVVERALEGREASVIVICDESAALALPAAGDHKRLADDDTGPNTGGVGAYSPLRDLDEGEAAALARGFHGPMLAALAERGVPFRGALYAGLMLTPDGPRLLECNARLGDPEAQAALPRLAVPLAPLLLAAATGRLAEAIERPGLRHRVVPTTPDAATAVVLAAPGYPGRPDVGAPIEGIDAARRSGALVFTAGVAERDGRLVTDGGRVATVVGRGATVEEASEAAYRAADAIGFPGRQLRRDIGRSPARAGVPA